MTGVDAGPFGLLMNRLHLQNDSLEGLVINVNIVYRICVLINIYELHETTSEWAGQWFEKIKEKMPHDPVKGTER